MECFSLEKNGQLNVLVFQTSCFKPGLEYLFVDKAWLIQKAYETEEVTEVTEIALRTGDTDIAVDQTKRVGLVYMPDVQQMRLNLLNV